MATFNPSAMPPLPEPPKTSSQGPDKEEVSKTTKSSSDSTITSPKGTVHSISTDTSKNIVGSITPKPSETDVKTKLENRMSQKEANKESQADQKLSNVQQAADSALGIAPMKGDISLLNERYSIRTKEFLTKKEQYENTKTHKNANELLTAIKNLAQANDEVKTFTPEKDKKNQEKSPDISQKLTDFKNTISSEKMSLLPDNSNWKKREEGQVVYYENIQSKETRYEFPKDDLAKEFDKLKNSLDDLNRTRMNLLAGERTGYDIEQLDGKIYALNEQLKQTRECINSYEINVLALSLPQLKEAYKEALALYQANPSNDLFNKANNALNLYYNNINILKNKYTESDHKYKIEALVKENSFTTIEKTNTSLADYNHETNEKLQLKDPNIATRLSATRGVLKKAEIHLDNLKELLQFYRESNKPYMIQKTLKEIKHFEETISSLTSEYKKMIPELGEELSKADKELSAEFLKAQNEYNNSPNSYDAISNLIDAFTKYHNNFHIFMNYNKTENANDETLIKKLANKWDEISDFGADNISQLKEKKEKIRSDLEKEELLLKEKERLSKEEEQLTNAAKKLFTKFLKAKNEYNNSPQSYAAVSKLIDATKKYDNVLQLLENFSRVEKKNEDEPLRKEIDKKMNELNTKQTINRLEEEKGKLLPDDSRWARRPDGVYFVKQTQVNLGGSFPWVQLFNELGGLETELKRLEGVKSQLEERLKAGEYARTASGEDLENIGLNILRLKEQIRQTRECLDNHPKPPEPPARE